MSSNLVQAALRGMGWGAISTGTSTLLQIVSIAVMARLLDPVAFGLMAMAQVGLRVFTYLAQLGMGAAIVQKPELSEADMRCAWGWSMLVSALAAAAAAALAFVIAAFFRSEALTPVLQLLAVNLLLQGATAVPLALLRRRMQFRAIAMIELSSYAFGYVTVGIIAAYLGAGVYSLVAAILAQSLLQLIGAIALVRPLVMPSLRGNRNVLFAYGMRHSAIGFLEFLTANLDTAIVGRVLGEAALGVYNRAMLLAFLPMERIAGVVSRVLFPVLSHTQNNRIKMGAAYLLGLSLVGVFGTVFSLAISAAANDVVLLLLGSRWQESTPILAVLSFSAPLIFMSVVSAVMCDALALLQFKMRLQAATLLIMAALMMIGISAGTLGVAWAILGAEAIRHGIYMRYLCKQFAIGQDDVIRLLSSLSVAAIVSYALVSASVWWGMKLDLPLLPRVLLDIAAGAVSLAIASIVWMRLMIGRSSELLAAEHLPAWRQMRIRLVRVAS